MKKDFNEMDHWFLKNWKEARDFETTVQKVRDNYEEFATPIFDRVKESFPELELNFCKPFMTSYGQLAFSKHSWLSARAYPSGIWLGGIGLDNLLAQEGDVPYCSVWIDPPENALRVTMDDLRSEIAQASKGILKGKNVTWELDRTSRGVGWYNLPEGRSGIAKMLLDSGGEQFIQCLANHVGNLAEFIPILDKAFVGKR